MISPEEALHHSWGQHFLLGACNRGTEIEWEESEGHGKKIRERRGQERKKGDRKSRGKTNVHHNNQASAGHYDLEAVYFKGDEIVLMGS